MDPATRIRTFDFRKPDKFSKEQLRTLAVLHDHVARRWASHCSTLFRLPTRAVVAGVEQVSYDEFVRNGEEGGMLALVAMPPLRGETVLTVDGRLALALIDRLCGGPGRWEGPARSLTDVERVALGRVVQDLVGVLVEGWAGLVEVEPRVQRVEDNPLFIQSVAGAEVGAAVRFHVGLGPQDGKIALFLPYFTLEPLLPRLNTQAWADRYRQGVHEGSEQVNHRLRQAPITLVVELGRVTLPMHRAMALKPGEILRLDTPAEGLLPLMVEGKPMFMGRAGRSGHRLAFRVESRTGLEGESDERDA